MTYAPLPLPILLLCIILFGMYLFKTRSRSGSTRPQEYIPEDEYCDLTKIIDEHRGWKAEEIEVSVLSEKSDITRRCPEGYPVKLVKTDSLYRLIVDGIEITSIRVPYLSDVRSIIDDSMPYEAFITAREIKLDSLYDFFTITVFYK